MKIYKRRFLTKLTAIGIILTVATFFASVALPAFTKPVDALSGSSFNNARIIDDAKFYRSSSMSATAIQNFLNARVPSCDTNGSKPYGGTTRKLYAQSRGVSTPFICLKNYTMNTPAKSAVSGMCSSMTAKSGRSAAKIIFDVSQACGIDSKVLLVMLEKEQSLVTDDWPWPIQYNKAMGYYCPDDPNNPGWCHPDYAGFFNQVYNAARQLKNYRKNPNSFNYASGRKSFVSYQANAPQCGGTQITMRNAATAALYNYTPYQPNSAALANLYGTGNGCSAYGNRNFWRIYNDWFGSTHAKCTSSDTTGINVYRLFSTKTARHYYTAFKCEADQLDGATSYKLEGVEFIQPEPFEPDRFGVFRLKKGSKWFWTQSVSERNNLINNHGYRLQGTSFIGLTKDSDNPNKLPVYRLYNSTTGGHLWTASVNERNHVNNNRHWKYEGIAFYMLPPQ